MAEQTLKQKMIDAIRVEHIRKQQYEHGGCRIYSQNGDDRQLIVDGYIDRDFGDALHQFVLAYFDSHGLAAAHITLTAELAAANERADIAERTLKNVTQVSIARGEQLTAAQSQLDELRGKLPVEKILAACGVIEEADNRAMACDGDVPPTASMMTSVQIQQCLSALWLTREAAEAARQEGEGK